MNKPLLIVLGGLPGSGKTTLSRALSQRLKGVYLRMDTIEQALRNANGMKVTGEGYAIAYALAEDNLRAGNDVITDAVNPLTVIRNAWRDVALRSAAKIIEIEVICSDKSEHRRRVETRKADIAGHEMPAWQDVISREYHTWDTKNITIDTAGKTAVDALESLMKQLTPMLINEAGHAE
jgi:predicted kinase